MNKVEKTRNDMNKFSTFLKNSNEELKKQKESPLNEIYVETPNTIEVNEMNENADVQMSEFKHLMTEDYDTPSRFKPTNTVYFKSIKIEYSNGILQKAFSILEKYDNLSTVTIQDRRIIIKADTKDEISKGDMNILRSIGFEVSDTML